MVPFKRRMVALKMLLDLERSTTKAIPYSEWPTPPEIHWENETARDFFYQHNL
jgi:hypothetical protein